MGFNYREHQCRKASGNMRSVSEHRDVVEEYIHKEREAGRLLGPFQPSAFPAVHVNPFGVIPKSEPGKWRLIVDMSSPEGGSVNEGICKEWCSLSYISVDDVAHKVVKLGKGALMAKFDLKAAYRNVPVHPDDETVSHQGESLQDRQGSQTLPPPITADSERRNASDWNDVGNLASSTGSSPSLQSPPEFGQRSSDQKSPITESASTRLWQQEGPTMVDHQPSLGQWPASKNSQIL